MDAHKPFVLQALQDTRDRPDSHHDRWIHILCRLSLAEVLLLHRGHTPYILSYSNCLMLISTCNPTVSRMVSSVDNCGFPSPRSMATNVLTATPAKSASVCWFTPNFLRRSLMAFPISCCVIIPIYCDFAAKIRKRFYTSKQNRNKLGILFFIRAGSRSDTQTHCPARNHWNPATGCCLRKCLRQQTGRHFD